MFVTADVSHPETSTLHVALDVALRPYQSEDMSVIAVMVHADALAFVTHAIFSAVWRSALEVYVCACTLASSTIHILNTRTITSFIEVVRSLTPT